MAVTALWIHRWRFSGSTVGAGGLAAREDRVRERTAPIPCDREDQVEITDASFEALIEALFGAGLARMADGNSHGRWERVA